ncbi:MAG: glycoside hydrolase family 1 protein, partial [Candidatus Helarchaeales archaeon]
MKFPDDFIFGAATSAYQIEGATKEDGRGRILFDKLFKIPFVGGNPNVACDHYHRYKEDVRLMKELGLQSYRFSIAWARIFPTGTGPVNEKGLKFYDNLIDELVKNEIEPLATLFHFDLPIKLHKNGGWRNENTVEAFVNYASTCFEAFGDRVRSWATFNEPWVDPFIKHFILQKLRFKRDKKVFAECLSELHGVFRAQSFFIGTNLDICPGDLDVAPGARLHAPWRVFNDFHQVM